MLLSYLELIQLIDQGVINAPIENVNAASIDLTLSDEIMVYDEIECFKPYKPVDLALKENIKLVKRIIPDHGYELAPGDFILASTREWFDLSKRNDISAEYKLKSSMARNGLFHALAGFADSGWSGNLTLEFHNVSREPLLLREGLKCGQMLFLRHAPVPDHASYKVKGQYNNQSGVTASRGIR